jgi:hypothetical protein
MDDSPESHRKNVADLTDDGSHFFSQDEPGQWICWDFHELRVRPTHYAIKCCELKSWVVESSLDFMNWTEIDRKTDNKDFNSQDWMTASFAVAKSAECRFIRLTQTGQNRSGNDRLIIMAFEVFGTLVE